MGKIFGLFIIAVVVTTFLNALVLIGIGIYKSFDAYLILAQTGLKKNLEYTL